MGKNKKQTKAIVKEETPEKKNGKKSGQSGHGIIGLLKRFFVLWIVVTLVVSAVLPVGIVWLRQDSYKSLQARVSFTYDGVEKGLAPDGNKFSADSIKNTQVVTEALERLGLPTAKSAQVQAGLTVKGVVPQNAMDRITAYENIFADKNAVGDSSTVQDRSYYPTQYTVSFDYAATGFNPATAEKVLNQVLTCYEEYFLKSYGFNKPFGDSIESIDYEAYDYVEAVELFDSVLATLQSYVDGLSREDSTRFCSKETGYTFADLSKAISTLRSMDLGMVSSYITLNTVTKDRESRLTYYQYALEDLESKKAVDEELLAAIEGAIEKYQKNVVFMFGTDTDNMDAVASGESKQYDAMFQQKLEVQERLSKTIQQIDLYNTRLERLRRYSQTNTHAMRTKVEKDLEKINEKVQNLLQQVIVTTEEYYRTVIFANAVEVLVPAKASAMGTFKRAIKDSLMTVVMADALIFAAYLAIALAHACAEGGKKKEETEDFTFLDLQEKED